MTFNSSAIIAQNYADKIIGFYHVEDPFSEDESIVEIYKANNGEYEARTIKMRYPYDKDGNLRLDKKIRILQNALQLATITLWFFMVSNMIKKETNG